MIRLEKIIEKMGLYDIWTVFFPGMFFLVSVKTLYNFILAVSRYISENTGIIEKMFVFCKANVYVPDTIYEFLIMCLYSYLVGLILHEISRLIKNKVVYKNGKPTDFLLDPEAGIFSKQQIQELMPMYIYLYGGDFSLNEKEKLKEESRFIFHKINVELQRKKIANQYVKLNIVYNTSATLGAAIMLVFFMAILFEIEFVALRKFDILIPTTILDIFMVISIYFLLNRSKAFYKYWVRNIVLAYYDIYLDGTSNHKKKNV